MQWSDILMCISNVAMGILAGWKLYDLIFPPKKELPPQPTYTYKDKVSDLLMTDYLLTRFYAELTYKTLKDNEKFEQAPPEVYGWIRQQFQDWSKQQEK